jgi:hypothetical protein
MPITSEVLAAAPAGGLPRKVFLRLVDVIDRRGRDQNGQRSYVTSLSPGLRMLWATYLLDNEVLNGGLEQYFFNSSRWYTAEALQGLTLLRADDHKALLTEAIDAALIAVGGDLAFDHPCWHERYGQAHLPALQQLTRRYWDLPLLEPLQAAYIQAHPGQFATE